MVLRAAFLLLSLACLAACAHDTYMAANGALYRGDYDTAIAGYRQDLSGKPDSLVVLRKLGYAQYKNGQFAEAAKTLEKVVALRPGDPDGTFFLGLSYIALDEREQGFEVLFNYKDWTRALMQQTIQEAAHQLAQNQEISSYLISDKMIEARDYGYCLQRTASMDPFSAEGDPRWERLDIPLSKNASCVGAPI